MSRLTLLAARVALPLCCALLVTGCMQQQTTGTNGSGTSANTLTQAQQDGTQAALAGIENLAVSSASVQSATGSDQNQSALTLPSNGSTTFGTCPEVTLTTTSGTAITANMTIDFGAGCNPLGNGNYTCAGSATGAISSLNQSLDATFNSFTCNNRALSGTLDLNWGRGGDEVDLTGDWDVSYANGQGTTWTTEGNALVGYDRANDTFTIGTFTGTIGDGTDLWNATAIGVAVSYTQNGNYIPQAGTVTMSGNGGYTLTIYFDSDSPATGEVLVTVDSGIPFTFDLDEL